MAGYIPVFDSVYHGTLCGKWPTLPVWLSILPMADKNGHIDMTYQAITALTGWPLDLLKQAIHDLMQPDPDSRSEEEEGRRLVLLDPDNRQWGWRIVNHSKYREKARLAAKNAREVESGKNVERMDYRKTAVDRRSPPLTDPSNANTNTYANTNTDVKAEEGMQGETARATRSLATRIPDDFALTDERKAIAAAEGIDPARTFASFTDYWKAAGGQKARKHDWDATWRNWCRRDADNSKAKSAPRKTRFEEVMEKLHAS